MKKLYYLIPIVITIILAYHDKLGMVQLREMDTIDLSTLLFAFPIILALTERFNELFIVKKDKIPQDITQMKELKKQNFNRAIMASFTVGVLLAIAGFRIIETFLIPPSKDLIFENTLFRSLDCILTAAVIAGGTEGWHQLIALISDITKAKREELKQ